MYQPYKTFKRKGEFKGYQYTEFKMYFNWLTRWKKHEHACVCTCTHTHTHTKLLSICKLQRFSGKKFRIWQGILISLQNRGNTECEIQTRKRYDTLKKNKNKKKQKGIGLGAKENLICIPSFTFLKTLRKFLN